MPSNAPFDTLEDVLNTARVRLNDAIQTLGGDIITDNAVFTLTSVTAAWRRLQQVLANYGISILSREFTWFSVPAVTQTDWGTQVWMNWDNFFDGTNLLTSPVLPEDMISPLDMLERINGNTQAYYLMDNPDSLPSVPQEALNRRWQWRDNKIFMPGATGLTDLRLRYSGYLPNFVANTTTAFNLQPVPIVNCLSPFSWFLCSEFARARGDMDAGSFDQLAIAECRMIFDRDTQQGKTIFKRAEYGKMPDGYTPPEGPQGPRGTTVPKG